MNTKSPRSHASVHDRKRIKGLCDEAQKSVRENDWKERDIASDRAKRRESRRRDMPFPVQDSCSCASKLSLVGWPKGPIVHTTHQALKFRRVHSQPARTTPTSHDRGVGVCIAFGCDRALQRMKGLISISSKHEERERHTVHYEARHAYGITCRFIRAVATRKFDRASYRVAKLCV